MRIAGFNIDRILRSPLPAVCLLVVIALLAACSSNPAAPLLPFVNDDRAPDAPFDASGIPDAVPKPEPRSRYGNPDSYVVFGQRYHVLDEVNEFRERGTASWYGEKFHGRRTSSGEPYDMYQMTAAHKSLPLPSYLRVTNLRNNRSVVVRVNDRGPFHAGRIVDLSYAAALKLDVVATGTAPVEIEVLHPELLDKPGTRLADNATVPETARPSSSIDSTNPANPVFIQLGAFSEADNALGLKGKLEVAGIRPVRIDEERAERLFRVRVGPFAATAAADDIALKLVALGITDFSIVSE